MDQSFAIAAQAPASALQIRRMSRSRTAELAGRHWTFVSGREINAKTLTTIDRTQP